jgi:tetratricopeptide (TPR) repeat protein
MGFLWGATAYYQKCLTMQDKIIGNDGPFLRAYVTTYPAYELARIYHEKGDIPDAVNLLKLALEFQSDFSEAIEYLQKIQNLTEQ